MPPWVITGKIFQFLIVFKDVINDRGNLFLYNADHTVTVQDSVKLKTESCA